MLKSLRSFFREVILTISTITLFIINSEIQFGGKLTKQTQNQLKIFSKTQNAKLIFTNINL